MSHHAWLTFALLAASCTRPAPAPCPTTIREVSVAAPAPSVAIVFVVQGEEIWLGNDDIEPEYDPDHPGEQRPNPAHYPGVLNALKRAVDAADFASLPSPASAALVMYADEARLRVPLGPIDRFDSLAFGSQRDYYGHIGRSLLGGLELGLAELERASASRKFLVVFGDGTDTNTDTARDRLALVRHRLDEAHVQTVVLVRKGPLSDPGNLFRDWPGTSWVESQDELAQVLASIKRRAARRN